MPAGFHKILNFLQEIDSRTLISVISEQVIVFERKRSCKLSLSIPQFPKVNCELVTWN